MNNNYGRRICRSAPISVDDVWNHILFYDSTSATQSEKRETFKNNEKGDRVITKFGVHGKIVEVNDQNDSCVVETMAGKLKMERVLFRWNSVKAYTAIQKITTKSASGAFFMRERCTNNSLDPFCFYSMRRAFTISLLHQSDLFIKSLL